MERLGSLSSPDLTCSAITTNRTRLGTRLGTTAKHFQMLRKFAYRNTDATSFDNVRIAADSTIDETRKLLQGKRILHHEIRTGLYKRLPHKLRLAIAMTNGNTSTPFKWKLCTLRNELHWTDNRSSAAKRDETREILKALV